MKNTYTYQVKMGDVAKFPNGVEINYDESTESLVILHPSKSLVTRRDESLLMIRATVHPAKPRKVFSDDIDWTCGNNCGAGWYMKDDVRLCAECDAVML